METVTIYSKDHVSDEEYNLNNKLIAEFESGNKTEMREVMAGYIEEAIIVPHGLYPKDYTPIRKLEYALSYDWIIPIVIKIDKINLDIEISIKGNKCEVIYCEYKYSPNNRLFIGIGISKKYAIWVAVSEYIKYYNKMKQI